MRFVADRHRAVVFTHNGPLGARAIEAGVRLFGTDRVVFGTDGTEFGCEWSTRAVADAEIGADARTNILHRNSVAMLSHLVPLARSERIAA